MSTLGIDRTCPRLLSVFLADSFTLYLNSHKAHWNVMGSDFRQAHSLFEDIYQDLWQSIDIIAERIRALGYLAPGSYAEYSNLTTIPILPREQTDSTELSTSLLLGIGYLKISAQMVLNHALKINDQVTADILIERVRAIDKFAWMLRATISTTVETFA